MEAKVDILTRSAVLTRAVADHIKDSIVYMDEAGGEAAFATYGLKLLQGWVVPVRCFLPFRCICLAVAAILQQVFKFILVVNFRCKAGDADRAQRCKGPGRTRSNISAWQSNH